MEIFTESAQATKKLGQELANNLIEGKSPNVICLYGDLGSGKTTFIQGLAEGFGIKERVLSPTFILMRQYSINSKPFVSQGKQSAISKLFHVDLYRINGEMDAEPLGLEDIWTDPKNVIAIEWPEKIKNILPEKRVEIYFEYLGEDKRRIKINSEFSI